MSIERRYLPTESCPVGIETRADGAKVITGYASVFYVEGDQGTEYQLFTDLKERIMPRAFNRALTEKHNAAALFNHDPNMLLGRVASKTLKLSKDQRGLKYEVTPPTARADVVEAIERGDVTGSSFGFRVLEQKFKTERDEADNPVDIREIHSVELLDVAPVVYPAFQGTSVGIRAVGDANEARSAYDSWKAEQRAEADKAAALQAKLKTIRERAAEVK
jgi:uncharacterized protein